MSNKPKRLKLAEAAKLFVPKRACSSCPYRRDVPSGVWAREHYELLRDMDSRRTIKVPMLGPNDETVMVDAPNPNPGTFHCHQSNATGRPTVCRGWLSVERNSIGVRLLASFGGIEYEDIPDEDESATYYSSGTEAAEAGLRDIENPSSEARLLCRKLVGRGAGRWGEDDDEDEEESDEWDDEWE